MKFLINQNNGYIIEIFSIYHLLLILLTFSLVILVINNKEKFINLSSKKKITIRLYLAFIILINMIIRRGSFIYYGVYDWHNHLDINFCNFTSIMFLIYGLTGNKKIYNICYYMAFIGPLLSILLPSAPMKPLNYSFYSFLIIHHLIFIFNFIFMFMENKQYDKKNFRNTIIFLIVYFLIIYVFNYFMGTNYNMPLTFVNSTIEEFNVISYLSNYNFIVFCIFITIIIILLNFGKFILKILNNKR